MFGMRRRALLASTATLLSATFAGCTGLGPSYRGAGVAEAIQFADLPTHHPGKASPSLQTGGPHKVTFSGNHYGRLPPGDATIGAPRSHDGLFEPGPPAGVGRRPRRRPTYSGSGRSSRPGPPASNRRDGTTT